MFELKIDPRNPYHYIIAIAIHNMRSTEAGKMFLRYNPIYFTNKDVENIQNAALLTVDKVFKTTNDEAVKMWNCEELVNTIGMLKMSASANDCTLHHFSSSFIIPDYEQWFSDYVKNANKIPSIKRKILNAKISSY